MRYMKYVHWILTMRKFIGCWFFIGMLTACQAPSVKETCRTLSVDLTQEPASFTDIFSHMELIPLETNDSCLLININKLVQFQEALYIFDAQRPALYVFDPAGNFIRQIAKKGNGPGEYQLIYDFALDKKQNQIILLSPYGFIQSYSLEGDFIEKKVLPVKPNYYSIDWVDADHWVLWSCVNEEEEGITLVDRDSMNRTNGYWHNDRILDMGIMKPFYSYEGQLYFTTAYQNVVYEVETDTLRPSYQWDFGREGIHADLLEKYLSIENEGQRNDQLLNDLADGNFPFAMTVHHQNKRFYSVSLQKGLGTADTFVHVFYDKVTGRSYIFDNKVEGMSFRPLWFTDDYVLSLVYASDERTPFQSFLPTEDFAALTSQNEDDNPWLVKYYFN